MRCGQYPDIGTMMCHLSGWMGVEQATCPPHYPAEVLHLWPSLRDRAMVDSPTKLEVRRRDRRMSDLLPRTSVAIRLAASIITSSSSLPPASCTVSSGVSGLPRPARFESETAESPTKGPCRGACVPRFENKLCDAGFRRT